MKGSCFLSAESFFIEAHLVERGGHWRVADVHVRSLIFSGENVQTSADREAGRDETGNVVDLDKRLADGDITKENWESAFRQLVLGRPDPRADLLTPWTTTEAATAAHERRHQRQYHRALVRAQRQTERWLRRQDFGLTSEVSRPEAEAKLKRMTTVFRMESRATGEEIELPGAAIVKAFSLFSGLQASREERWEIAASMSDVRLSLDAAKRLLGFVVSQGWITEGEARHRLGSARRTIRTERRQAVERYYDSRAH